MKKIFFITAAFVVLVSCGNNTANANDKQDSSAMADSMSKDASEVQSEESLTESVESEDETPVANVDYDVSVRTTDLDSDSPRYEAIIRIDGKTVQVAEGYTEGYPSDMLESFGNVWQADVNFDGYDDIMISLGMEPVSDQAFKLYDAWVYSPSDGKFYKSKDFREICNPEVDTKNKRILSHYIARDGHTKVYSAVRLQPDGSVKEVGDGKTWTK